jgi:hypothetical protein
MKRKDGKTSVTFTSTKEHLTVEIYVESTAYTARQTQERTHVVRTL